jgi:hypothetical protein
VRDVKRSSFAARAAEGKGTKMILVAYASKHGATQGIAERIAETLTAAGLEAEARSVQAAGELSGHEAFVIGRAELLPLCDAGVHVHLVHDSVVAGTELTGQELGPGCVPVVAKHRRVVRYVPNTTLRSRSWRTSHGGATGW